MDDEPLQFAADSRGVALITLNRPEVHNAFDERLIDALTQALERVRADPAIRVLVLAANGKSFSAGADLSWMQRAAGGSREENLAGAERLSSLMHALDTLPKPAVARVQGAAIGGGLGLVACCDIAVAAEAARFALSEVRLGLIPAVIGPYVRRAIGARQARRYFLSGERIPATEAVRIGLVHEAVAAPELDAALSRIVDALLEAGPLALGAAKQFLAGLEGRPIDEETRRLASETIADLRASEEGREGIAAFLEKRPPRWRP